MPRSKKFYDIIPPKKEKQLAEVLPSVKESGIPKPKKSFRLGFPVFSFIRKPLVIIMLALIIGGGFCYFFIASVEIEIWPQAEAVSFETEVSVIDDFLATDMGIELTNVVSGKVIGEEKTFTDRFPATGKDVKDHRSAGTIKVYNNYHLEQILVANTRFWCFVGDDVREFKTKKRVVVSAKSELDVQVVASEAGEAYNIDLCTFSIPGLKGTSRYSAVYGKSFTSMTGGFEGESLQVTQNDLDEAKNILTQRALKESKDSLRSGVMSEFVLIEETLSQEIVDSFPLAEAGQITETFTYQIVIETTAFVFKKSDLNNFARKFILNEISQNKKIQEERLKTEWQISEIDLDSGEVFIDLSIEGVVYEDINEEDFRERVRGKNIGEIESVIAQQPEITKAQIKFWPFWVKKTPNNIEKIKVIIRLD